MNPEMYRTTSTAEETVHEFYSLLLNVFTIL